MRKGQITAFIILGLVVLVSAATIFFIATRQADMETEQAKVLDISNVQTYLESCVAGLGEQVVYTMAFNSGYYSFAGESVYGERGYRGNRLTDYYYIEEYQFPYVLQNTDFRMRPLSDIEEIIGNYVSVEFDGCRDLSVFEDLDIDLADEIKDLSVTVALEEVIIEFENPTIIKKGDVVREVNQYVARVDLRFGLLYQNTLRLLQELKDTQSVSLFDHCDLYTPADGLINIYVEADNYDPSYFVRFVDIKPLQSGKSPLKFQYAIRDVELYGECVG